MLTPKQTPLALIGMFFACSLAEGDPEKGKLIIALCTVIATVLYVLVCNYYNQQHHERKESELHR